MTDVERLKGLRDIANMLDEAIAAQSVTDEEVQRAIKHFKSLQKRYSTQHDGKNCKLVDLAIQALKQINPQKPCVICADGFVCCDTDEELRELAEKVRMAVSQGDQYCRFCGRKLKGE